MLWLSILDISSWQGRNHASNIGGSESSETRIEGEAQEEAGGGLGRGSVIPASDFVFGILNFKSFNLVYSWKVNLQIIHFIAM